MWVVTKSKPDPILHHLLRDQHYLALPLAAGGVDDDLVDLSLYYHSMCIVPDGLIRDIGKALDACRLQGHIERNEVQGGIILEQEECRILLNG